MLTFIEILIGIVVIVGVARYIIKGYSGAVRRRLNLTDRQRPAGT